MLTTTRSGQLALGVVGGRGAETGAEEVEEDAEDCDGWDSEDDTCETG